MRSRCEVFLRFRGQWGWAVDRGRESWVLWDQRSKSASAALRYQVSESAGGWSLIYLCTQPMKQILTRLVLTVPVVWLVVSLVFLLIHLVPGDPIQQMHGEGVSLAILACR